MNESHISMYREKLSIGQFVVLRKKSNDEKWIEHGAPQSIMARLGTGQIVDSHVVGACVMGDEVAVLYCHTDGSLRVLHVTNENRRSVYQDLISRSQGGVA